MSNFEYTIVGAGPTGLTLAYVLGTLGRKCLLLDSNPSIGGCHRVLRVNGLFTEHSPRIYSTSYVNTATLLCAMNIPFNEIFTPYTFSITRIGSKTTSSLRPVEIAWLGVDLIMLFFNSKHGLNLSMKDYMMAKNFSLDSQDYVDRLCRLTDGAGVDRYSLNEFLGLVNCQTGYTVLQPKLPLDVGLFKQWQASLDATGHVTTVLGAQVTSVTESGVTYTVSGGQPVTIGSSRTILAIPPTALISLLSISPEPVRSTFGDIGGALGQWAVQTAYIVDIGITFHWNSALKIPTIWGFPASDWGMAWVILTDYMNFNSPQSLTVISAAITRTDSPSSVTGKTASQTGNQTDLIAEAFQQLSSSFPVGTLPPPTTSLIDPNVSYNGSSWVSRDSAYLSTAGTQFREPQGLVKNIYQVGTQNGRSKYVFTSMESAVSNALHLAHELEPSARKAFPIVQLRTLSDVIRTIVLGVIVLTLAMILMRRMSRVR